MTSVGSLRRGTEGTPKSGADGPMGGVSSERMVSSMRPMRCSRERP